MRQLLYRSGDAVGKANNRKTRDIQEILWLTSRITKKIMSTPFRMTKIQNSHHVAVVGNSRVKHRLGWSSKNLNSSQRLELVRTIFEANHIVNLSMHGNPVLPMMMRKLPSSKGRTAYWNDNIESGVRVYPRSLNNDAGVKKPLKCVSHLCAIRLLDQQTHTTKLSTVRPLRPPIPTYQSARSREAM